MIKIYFSFYYQDYIFLEEGESMAYGVHEHFDGLLKYSVSTNHLKNSRRHKDKRDKEVIFIVTVKD